MFHWQNNANTNAVYFLLFFLSLHRELHVCELFSMCPIQNPVKEIPLCIITRHFFLLFVTRHVNLSTVIISRNKAKDSISSTVTSHSMNPMFTSVSHSIQLCNDKSCSKCLTQHEFHCHGIDEKLFDSNCMCLCIETNRFIHLSFKMFR